MISSVAPPSTVSIHAPARGATDTGGGKKYENMFQSTRPRGARLILTRWPLPSNKFQSTRPRGARHPHTLHHYISMSFNPRARAGRDVYATLTGLIQGVSIHAPARGATGQLHQQAGRPGDVSIHAPARGATGSGSGTGSVAMFQSTRPRGARPPFLPLFLPFLCFNPRARAGRDFPRRDGLRCNLCFNPRARAGRDDNLVFFICRCLRFQSTRPRGARPTTCKILVSLIISNTIRERCIENSFLYSIFKDQQNKVNNI